MLQRKWFSINIPPILNHSRGDMRFEQFSNGDFFHIFNRGVDKRETFIDEKDYFRFLDGLRIFNTIERQTNHSFAKRRIMTWQSKNNLVDIHCFSLMPNHFHLLVEQVKDDGISRFLHKIGTGYTKYFNKRHGRTGALFESVFKARYVKDEAYLEHLIAYIHSNPLDTFGVNWKEDGVSHDALYRLQGYRWSSYRSYRLDLNVPGLEKSVVQNIFPTPQDLDDHMLY